MILCYNHHILEERRNHTSAKRVRNYNNAKCQVKKLSEIWIGRIFFKEEGGYEIILKSLNHYKKRMKTIGNSPELKDSAAMFASVLQQEARKTVPRIEQTIQKITQCLSGVQPISTLIEDIPFFEKALVCYESDIKKARESGYEYFVELVGGLENAQKDVYKIETALEKVKQFSD